MVKRLMWSGLLAGGERAREHRRETRRGRCSGGGCSTRSRRSERRRRRARRAASGPPQNIATAITEVSERATLLVREEIELAKAEVTEKATKLVKGAVVGVAAGVFFLMALIFALVGCAWLLYYYLPGNDFTYFWGFFAMAVILVRARRDRRPDRGQGRSNAARRRCRAWRSRRPARSARPCSASDADAPVAPPPRRARRVRAEGRADGAALAGGDPQLDREQPHGAGGVGRAPARRGHAR